jgi:uncharacterized membrane protein YfcA
MEVLILALVAFVASLLTFFSGFGLGTILTPVFMVFFPVDLSIALTGIVHFFNNIFKLVLVGRSANRAVVIRFGLPAVIAALLGAWLMLQLSGLQPFWSYTIWGKQFELYPIKFTVALLLMTFALLELSPWVGRLRFDRSRLPLGGFLSGFFGGLSGNQGALRSAFLINAGLSKEAFVGTAVVVSTFVDLTRLGVYATRFAHTGLGAQVGVLSVVISAAIFGAWIGNRMLKKVTMRFIQLTVAIMLIIISIGLGAGWI